MVFLVAKFFKLLKKGGMICHISSKIKNPANLPGFKDAINGRSTSNAMIKAGAEKGTASKLCYEYTNDESVEDIC